MIPFLFAVLIVLNSYVISLAEVVNVSMEPTYYEGDKIVIEHFGTITYSRGEVVIVHVGNSEYYIKRIIGLPGDTVTITNNEITVNGELYIEDLVLYDDSFTACKSGSNASIEETCTWEVPSNSYFLLGDNRTSSTDSRSVHIGFVEEDSLYGRVIYTLPFGSD